MVEVREFWTVNHAKALFLMSKFAQAAVTAEDAESWIFGNVENPTGGKRFELM